MMSVGAWTLPWRGPDVPHAVVDILRGCNISCTACYNTAPPCTKPLADIEAELDRLLELRRLSSVTVVGGEITLHPDLCEIVRAIKHRGLHAELCTNGLDLDDAFTERISQAGADIIYLHIERGQRRPDLPAPNDPQAVRALREEKVDLVARHGIDVGLTVTARDDWQATVQAAVQFTLDSQYVNYLLVTLCRDVQAIRVIRGDLEQGLTGEVTGPTASESLSNREVAAFVQGTFGFQPFGVMGSSVDPEDPRWLSYFLGTVRASGGTLRVVPLRASWFERVAVRLVRQITGRYPMYLPQNGRAFRLQLLLNALTGGAVASNLLLLWRSLGRGAESRAKRLLFQNPAEVAPDGRVVHCRHCPDAVLKGDRLVPVCIADRVEE